MKNALTIDVEDYPTLMARFWFGREQPPTEAVVRNTQSVLDLLEAHHTRATFFVLGEVAAAFPDLIRLIESAGHELGVHGYYHHPVFTQTPDQFRKEVADAKSVLEDRCGHAVRGHRAPAFSIIPQTRWALDILAELGFEYDSSIFPIKGRRYGWPGFPLDIHEMTLDGGRRIIEVPMSTVALLSRRWPVCGGGYLRHFPGWVTRWAMRRVIRERPAIVYVHPHEMDPTPVALDASAATLMSPRKLRMLHHMQMRRRATVGPKLDRLLKEFDFAPLSEIIAAVLPRVPRPSGVGA